MSVLAELRELLAKATPGPYKPTHCDTVESDEAFDDDLELWWVHHGGWIDQDDAGLFFTEVDAKCYAALRNHAEALLDIAEEAERAADWFGALVNVAQEHCPESLGEVSETISETPQDFDPVPMVCYSCENSARQWGYYQAHHPEDEESCPICGSDDVAARPSPEEGTR